MSRTFPGAARALLVGSLGLAAASCQLSTSGLLKQASTGGTASSSEPSTASETDAEATARLAAESDQQNHDRRLVFHGEVDVVEPERGAPRIDQVTPTWCDGVDVTQVDADSVESETGRRDYERWERAAETIAATCVPSTDPKFLQQRAYLLQRWANLTGAGPSQLGALFALRRDPAGYRRMKDETCAKLAYTDEAPTRDKALTDMARSVFGCSADPRHVEWSNLPGDRHRHWNLDRDARFPDQLSAIYQVLDCVGLVKTTDLDQLADFAACRGDVAQLDEKALAAELKAAGHSAYAQVIAAQAMAAARSRAGAMEQALQALAKRDPEVGTVLLETPTKARAAWIAAVKANRAAVDAAHAYEERYTGPRKSAARGCLAEALGNLQHYVGAHGGATREAILAAATDEIGGILLEHARSCLEREERDLAARELAMLIGWGPPRRGPRYAARVAMIEAVATIASDRPAFPITGAMVGVQLDGPVPVGSGARGTWSYEAAGTVAKVERKGGLVYVTFKTEAWVEDEEDCKEGSKIVMFRPDGSPIREWLCRRTGRTITRSSTAAPFYTVAELASGIAVGTFVRYRAGGTTDAAGIAEGVPGEVWKTKAQKVLLAYVGLPAR